jgi:hypothetical protein
MNQVFAAEGKAEQVFKYLKLVSKYKGATTLAQLKKQGDKKK